MNIFLTSIQISEYFLEFLKVDATSKKYLFDAIINARILLNLILVTPENKDYDNGSNMKGKYQGIQKIIRH